MCVKCLMTAAFDNMKQFHRSPIVLITKIYENNRSKENNLQEYVHTSDLSHNIINFHKKLTAPKTGVFTVHKFN